MNRPFGVPALAGLDRLKARLQTSGVLMDRFMVPLHAKKRKGALHEPQGAADILLAERSEKSDAGKMPAAHWVRRLTLLFAGLAGITLCAMKTNSSGTASGRVASLHLHPAKPGEPLEQVDAIEVVADKGILGEPRYFGRISSRTGKPARRQVSLIEREQIDEHAAALGLETIPPGEPIEIGEAILLLCDPRTPCERMDAVCLGLRALMENHRQGVLAQVVKSGRIGVDDPIRLAKIALTG
jgi:hypothetical protein